jgi:hypothetical protein
MCCSNCFHDRWIEAFVARKSDTTGTCPHCGSENVLVIDPAELAEKFEGLLDAYSIRAGGAPLVKLLNEDWQLFALDDVKAARLLRDILGDAATHNYAPRRGTTDDAAIRWAELKSELKNTNRFFPKNAPDRDQFASVIGELVSTDVPNELFRARIFKNERVFELNDLRAPPADVATDGRANPVGIPYLYLASDVDTAISEVRPSKASRVAVAKFSRYGDPLTFIDLSDPRGTLSPFAVDADRIGEVRASMDFLCALGKELSTPAAPHRANIDYLASQYLCELVKSIGYDGVIYTSSLTSGRNFAVFDPAAFEPKGTIDIYAVTSTDVTFELETTPEE